MPQEHRTPRSLSEAREHLNNWYLHDPWILASGRSDVTATAPVGTIDPSLSSWNVEISLEAWESLRFKTYVQLYEGLATNSDWGIDRELGVVSARAVWRLAKDRQRSRLIDHWNRRRHADTAFVLEVDRLDHPTGYGDSEGEGEGQLLESITADRRRDVVAEVLQRDRLARVLSQPMPGHLILLAPALGLPDKELGTALAAEPAWLRKQRQRLRVSSV